MADQTETTTPSTETPLFPCAPHWIPSWTVRLNGGERNKADGGRTIYIDYFHMTTKTLSYRTEGAGNFYDPEWHGTVEDQIEKGLQRAKQDIEDMWGTGRPTYIVRPDFKESPLAPGSWSSPRYRCFAWVSSTALDGEKHGSHAFLIWWQEGGSCGMPDYDPTVDTPSVVEAVERILKAVPWETIAADFYI